MPQTSILLKSLNYNSVIRFASYLRIPILTTNFPYSKTQHFAFRPKGKQVTRTKIVTGNDLETSELH
jgi:hypothetical protein